MPIAPPYTRTPDRAPDAGAHAEVWYAYQITINGRVVGTLTQFNLSSSRDAERVREINSDRGSEVTHIVMSGVVEHRVSARHVKLYKQNLFQALGQPVYTIEQLDTPFDIVETVKDKTGKTRVIVYEDCVITSYSKNIETTATTILEDAEIQVSRIRAPTPEEDDIGFSLEPL